MPEWYWDKRELAKTPSLEQGMNNKAEIKLRQEGVR